MKPLFLMKTKLIWYEICEDGSETEHTDMFEGFTFESIKKQMEDFMIEKGVDIVKNKCRTEVIA